MSTRSNSCASAPIAQVAAVLSRMASDDAADLLLEIEQDRRLPVLNLLPAGKQRKIKALLGYNPSTAGGHHEPRLRLGLPRTRRVATRSLEIRASELGAAATLDRVRDRRPRACSSGPCRCAELMRARGHERSRA